IAISPINVTRFLCEYIQYCPPGVTSSFLVKGDIIALLVELMLNKPWIRKKDGKTIKFEDLQWVEMKPPDEEGKQQVPKTEGQVWFALLFLITDVECQRKYQFDHTKSEGPKKLLKFLNDDLIDQISPLQRLRQVIHTLGVTQLPESKGTSDFLKIQTV
ncbi:MAG: hypothetical protein EZS28_048343, partial [Streblomastix strix]